MSPNDAAQPFDAAHTEVNEDAGTRMPAPRSTSGGCPVHISVQTFSYGTGNNDDDDYAPNNVGAVWITDAQHAFVRTVAVWGPNYWSFAETWVRQSGGSRVDIVAGATRKNHAQPIEADWDCRDENGARVTPGTYRVNVEFAETEQQGPLLTRDSALEFELGDAPRGATREPGKSFGPIVVRVVEP
ncbi:MAG TPA: DUF2271 domain-containing protein [Polyangiales bacterium]|nr:DUF2271 domain-containing protein [Polyangiales bacterium]